MLKYEITTLQSNIIENIDYIEKEFPMVSEILSEINWTLSINMQHSLLFQWWVQNEESINTINEILKKRVVYECITN